MNKSLVHQVGDQTKVLQLMLVILISFFLYLPVSSILSSFFP
jgi:hypothetical protein